MHVDFATPLTLTLKTLVDYICIMVAVGDVTLRGEWDALKTLGTRDSGGEKLTEDDNNGGGDDDDDFDDADKRVRMQRGGKLAPNPQGPVLSSTPSKLQTKKQAALSDDLSKGELLSCKEFVDGSTACVVASANRVQQLLVARKVNCAKPKIIENAGIRISIQQQPTHIDVPTPSGMVQRCIAIVILRVEVDALRRKHNVEEALFLLNDLHDIIVVVFGTSTSSMSVGKETPTAA